LDPSRLISCAEAGNRIAVQETWRPEKADDFQQDGLDASRWRPGHADEWYRLIDVLSANLYLMNPGEAQATYRRYVEMTKPFNKPVILSEFGSMSLRDTRVPRRVLGNEARHAAILREAYRVFARLPDLTGYCPWCLVDTRAPTHWRWYNQGKGVFRYGLLDEEWREKRTVYRALKKSIAVLKRRYGESQMEQRGK
jgi:beta-glucuronidase